MHQLSLFVIIVVISGALCEDAVVLMAECPRTKLLNMDPKGKVYLSPEGPPTPNITLGGRIITTADGRIMALTTLYFKPRQRYLCFDSHGKLRGEFQLTDRCYFLENDVRGKYEYRLWQNEKLVVQFRRKGGNPPCSEFHKIDSEKYHAVPSTIRASARTSFPNNEHNIIHSSNHNSNHHKNNTSLSTIGGNASGSISGENRHRHRHGSQRKQVERRRSHQRQKELERGAANDSAMTATGQQNGAAGKHLQRDRSKVAGMVRRKNRNKKHRQHRPGQGLSGPTATGGSQETGRKPEKNAEAASPDESIPNKDDSLTNSPRHRNGKRRSYSNVHDEYSNDEPSAINERPIQNSLTDFLDPSTKKYHVRNWIASIGASSSSSGNSGSLSRIKNGNAESIPQPPNTSGTQAEDADPEIAGRSSISNSSSRSSVSSIASSQPLHSHMKKYYQNKTAHEKAPAVIKPDKMRRLRSRVGRTNDNSN